MAPYVLRHRLAVSPARTSYVLLDAMASVPPLVPPPIFSVLPPSPDRGVDSPGRGSIVERGTAGEPVRSPFGPR